MILQQKDKAELIKHINKSNLSDKDKSEVIAMIIASGNSKTDLSREFLKTLRVADTLKELYDLAKDLLNDPG